VHQDNRGRIAPRPVRLPRLYPIVDAETLARAGVSLRAFAQELRDAGVTLLQYRDKLGDRDQILRNAAAIAAVFRGVDATLVLNDSPELANLASWDGVHLGQGDGDIANARSLLPRNSIVGYSTHTPQQVLAADAAGADYIAIGPVFATATKQNHEPVVGLDGVRSARSLTTKPLVAIGGIALDNAASVIEAGADSVAIIGALFQKGVRSGDLVHAFAKAMPAAQRQ
jgi:thiamine-phosphate pyrophosphorylase